MPSLWVVRTIRTWTVTPSGNKSTHVVAEWRDEEFPSLTDAKFHQANSPFKKGAASRIERRLYQVDDGGRYHAQA
jgi:hypothetical protein